MIVVDANVIAYSTLGGPRSAAALSVRDRDPHWLVPPLWRSEFMNILAVYAHRCGVPCEVCLRIYVNAANALSPNEREPDASAVLGLAIRRELSAYDAQYVALAMAHAVPLITEDRELLRKFPDVALSMEAYLDRGSRYLKEPRESYRRVGKRPARRT